MTRFIKIPLEAIHWDEAQLKSFIEKPSNLFDRPYNIDRDKECYMPIGRLTGNLKSKIHKAFLYLSPEYRRRNGWPHALIDLPSAIINLYEK